jgi:hypothetical protein
VVTKTIEELEVMSPEEKRAHFAEEEKIVFGHNFQRDRTGQPIEQGIGSPGHQSLNSLVAIRKYEGEDAYRAALAKVWKDSPDHARRLNLPKAAAI